MGEAITWGFDSSIEYLKWARYEISEVLFIIRLFGRPCTWRCFGVISCALPLSQNPEKSFFLFDNFHIFRLFFWTQAARGNQSTNHMSTFVGSDLSLQVDSRFFPMAKRGFCNRLCDSEAHSLFVSDHHTQSRRTAQCKGLTLS